MSEQLNLTPNPKRYRELLEPFNDIETAQKRANDFFDEVAALRVKYGIPDAYLVLQASWKTTDGKEAGGIIPGGFGSPLEHEAMLAYALGIVQKERQERIGELLHRAIRRQPPR